jgi:glycosyltransferase involved in cell wall biosynthesis
MEQNILISVLIPTYNVEKFINSAIQSVINQTYSNLEIIVVDDGSTDQTYSILEKIKKSEPRLKLYKNKNNSGIVKTLNFGLSVSKGEYIVRMDGDDLCDPSKFEIQLKFLLNNKNVDLVGCDILSIDENDKILNHIETSHSVECTKKILEFISPVLHIWMCKKEIYTILNGYRELGGSEDYDFLLRLDALGFKFFNLPFFGYSVRIRSGNTQTSRGLYQRKIVYYIRKLYKERLRYNYDSFNVESRDNLTKSSLFAERTHKLSVKYTYKAMKYRSDKNYIMFALAIMISLVSPYQIKFYIENILVKYYLKKYN